MGNKVNGADILLLWHPYLYHIALKFCGSKCSQVADFELFPEKFLRTLGLHVKSAKVTKFSLNKFCE